MNLENFIETKLKDLGILSNESLCKKDYFLITAYNYDFIISRILNFANSKILKEISNCDNIEYFIKLFGDSFYCKYKLVIRKKNSGLYSYCQFGFNNFSDLKNDYKKFKKLSLFC